MRLIDLFPRLDALTPSARMQLSELLATAGSMPAILLEELGRLPLQDSAPAWRVIPAVVRDGLTPDALGGMRDHRLAELVPPVGGCDGDATARCPARSRQALIARGVRSWSELGALTLRELSTSPGVGPAALAGLVCAAIESVLDDGTSSDDGAVIDDSPESLPLAVLLLHGKAVGDERLRAALENLAAGDGPEEVRAAATSLLAAADRAGDPRLRQLDEVWQATGDHRDRGIFAHRCLRLARQTPVKELAAALDLSETRIGQIQGRTESAARKAAPAAVRRLAAQLREWLGPVCRLDAVDGALAAIGLPAGPATDPRAGLLVWLAGPYVAVPDRAGWLATDPARLRAETGRILREDGGVRPVADVTADLEALDVAAPDVARWLEAQPAAVVDGLVVALSGTEADVAERILAATGRAMSAADLAAWTTPGPQGVRALHERLRRDRRFLLVSRDEFELAEWGGDAFVEPAPAAPPELFPDVARARRAQLRIEVDTAALRGASAALPLAVVEALGVPRGGRRTFTTRYGPVALRHTDREGWRGSIRPVALAAGAGPGDVLLLDFDAATATASVELIEASARAAS